MRSIRGRLLVLAAVWLTAALLAAFLFLSALLEDFVTDRFDAEAGAIADALSASLEVSDSGRIGAVAERFLIAEDESGHAGDPLEPGECVHCSEPVAGSRCRQTAGRHDRVREDRSIGARRMMCSRRQPSRGILTEEESHLVAGQLPVPDRR